MIDDEGGVGMYFRQLLYEETSCASYLLGCPSHAKFAVVDPHVELVDQYIALAHAREAQIVAVFDTHVQADHVSGLPRLVERTGATAYLPAGAGVEFDHHPLADDETVELGNTVVRAISTPGHAPAHHSYLVIDRARVDEPWLVLTGDSLLVGDAGRPDLHAHGDQTPDAMARALYRSIADRLLTLPDAVLVYPSHYGGSVCGRKLSSNPASSIGFERAHNMAIQFADEDAFATALMEDMPPTPAQQAAIVAANRSGDPSVVAL
jgi:glyoxylase-like metal-dependent hydrolase (beta-lactamase superfamily II)